MPACLSSLLSLCSLLPRSLSTVLLYHRCGRGRPPGAGGHINSILNSHLTGLSVALGGDSSESVIRAAPRLLSESVSRAFIMPIVVYQKNGMKQKKTGDEGARGWKNRTYPSLSMEVCVASMQEASAQSDSTLSFPHLPLDYRSTATYP